MVGFAVSGFTMNAELVWIVCSSGRPTRAFEIKCELFAVVDPVAIEFGNLIPIAPAPVLGGADELNSSHITPQPLSNMRLRPRLNTKKALFFT